MGPHTPVCPSDAPGGLSPELCRGLNPGQPVDAPRVDRDWRGPLPQAGGIWILACRVVPSGTDPAVLSRARVVEGHGVVRGAGGCGGATEGPRQTTASAPASPGWCWGCRSLGAWPAAPLRGASAGPLPRGRQGGCGPVGPLERPLGWGQLSERGSGCGTPGSVVRGPEPQVATALSGPRGQVRPAGHVGLASSREALGQAPVRALPWARRVPVLAGGPAPSAVLTAGVRGSPVHKGPEGRLLGQCVVWPVLCRPHPREVAEGCPKASDGGTGRQEGSSPGALGVEVSGGDGP